MMKSGGGHLSRIGILAIIAIGVIVVMCSIDPSRAVITGGRQTIENPQSNKELLELAQFAVEQHNSNEGLQLKFVTLVSAEQQVVSGILYYLNLEAMSGGETHEYEAQVWVQPWRDFKSLEEFTMKQ